MISMTPCDDGGVVNVEPVFEFLLQCCQLSSQLAGVRQHRAHSWGKSTIRASQTRGYIGQLDFSNVPFASFYPPGSARGAKLDKGSRLP
jgi:hypothetical protein